MQNQLHPEYARLAHKGKYLDLRLRSKSMFKIICVLCCFVIGRRFSEHCPVNLWYNNLSVRTSNFQFLIRDFDVPQAHFTDIEKLMMDVSTKEQRENVEYLEEYFYHRNENSNDFLHENQPEEVSATIEDQYVESRNKTSLSFKRLAVCTLEKISVL